MITRLLVANRAEIASRVFRTCRRLGIETVAVHSDADAGLPYVREADLAVRLPGSTPAETYLDIDAVLAAAKAAGADAIHPGYGFLSENADFARAVIGAGLVWVGPAPESIEAMGSKIRAKEIMRAAGVPVLEAPDEPGEEDLPLLVKASAGGGGRGMRVVRRLEELPGELAAAEAEAASAFGDGTVFVEPYVERGRHVEVQVVGTSVYGDRDCSLQRRHQKVVEEAPAPGLSDEVREALHDAARKAAEAIDYRGAGTVEFLFDPATERFWFLEMNTRLQVEHPVTELVHDIDLVAMQLAAAEGADAAVVSTGSTGDGHAIEVRLYAEDPAAGDQPQSGTLTRFEVPLEEGIRVDTGYESGSVVSTHYDAMLAKVVAHAPTREQAARKLTGVLSRARIHGVQTNRDQLVMVLRDERFLAGEVSTAFLSEASRLAALAPRPPTAAHAAAIALAERARESRTVQQGIPVAWRNVVSQPQVTELDDGTEDGTTVEWWGGRDGYVLPDAAVISTGSIDGGCEIVLEEGGVRTTYVAMVEDDQVFVDWPGGHAAYRRKPRFVDPADVVASGSLLAPMPGTVVSVNVEKGQSVEAGQPVLVLEAMKMQHTVRAPDAGTVTQIDVEVGGQVAAGAVLAVVSTSSTSEE
ncbi:MAG TPA: biotin carboxylase N-terminal domain-containing protein [Nocardioides sp.]|uniref:acetyl/propionyl/methylcrotonyl-CoA carboxylase subunit alpha n=1 Tax=Nocardioides sp. TaxID=35761 RepID=UPI002E36602F|nr:biotin carboxylase N-terminal domain-containing protein [Nocardioides sp.]HEX5086601.1 biotin carboxylase N-terminal domain-containing protein [Nocardioides sp.]